MNILFKYSTLILDKFLARSTLIVNGDSLPKKMPIRTIVVAIESDETWCVGLKCPCGCGYIIELPIIEEAKPRWDISLNSKGKITLHPSVFLKRGCKSHFWIKSGRIIWCKVSIRPSHLLPF